MRTMIASGRSRVHGVEVEPDLVEHPRRVVLDDDVARSRSSSCEQFAAARALRMSSVTLFLLVFSPEKIGDRSHHWSSVTGTPAISRVPSGRRRRLDVDHLGAEHRQHVRARAARPRRWSCRARAARSNGSRSRTAFPVARGRSRPGHRGGSASVCSPSRGAARRRAGAAASHAVRRAGLREPVARIASRTTRVRRTGRAR